MKKNQQKKNNRHKTETQNPNTKKHILENVKYQH